MLQRFHRRKIKYISDKIQQSGFLFHTVFIFITEKTRSTKGRTPASRRRRKNDSESEVVPKPRTVRKSARKSKKRVIDFDSDEDELLEAEWDEITGAEKENVEV
jgi:hypothetical protein